MTTKAEERKALAQIRKIVEGLGEFSYIGTAMAGMIEDAEDNIENDWAMSWKDRATEAEKRVDSFVRDIESLKEQNKNQTKMIELRDEWLQQKSQRIEELNAQMKGAAETIGKQIEEIREKTELLAERELETIKLKAKLYDLLVK